MASDRSSDKKLRLTTEQCRAVDRYAIRELGIPSLVLMENAGRNAADHIARWIRARLRRQSQPARVAVLCGKGNNGGDGFVIARHLVNRGYAVSIDLWGAPASLSPDAAVNHAIVEKMNVRIRVIGDHKALPAAVRRWQRCELIVDALLGTGFAGEVREPLAGAILRLNALKGPMVVAIDVPSGLDADAGCAKGVAVRAHRTITFLAEKVGYHERCAKRHLGRVTVADIGAPMEWILDRWG